MILCVILREFYCEPQNQLFQCILNELLMAESRMSILVVMVEWNIL